VPAPTTFSTSTVPQPTGTHPPNAPFTDLTSQGLAFIGCAPEERHVVPSDGGFRTLAAASFASDTMTNEACGSFCRALGYAFSGTEYRRECWCDNSYAPTRAPGTTLASLAGCNANFACSGDASQICGGDSWLSLYAVCQTGQACVNAVFT